MEAGETVKITEAGEWNAKELLTEEYTGANSATMERAEKLSSRTTMTKNDNASWLVWQPKGVETVKHRKTPTQEIAEDARSGSRARESKTCWND